MLQHEKSYQLCSVIMYSTNNFFTNHCIAHTFIHICTPTPMNAHTYTLSLIRKENTYRVALSDPECHQAAAQEIKSCCFVQGPEEGEAAWRFSDPSPSNPASHLWLLHPQASSATSSTSLTSCILVQTGLVRTGIMPW